ncbi:hypothetical protein D3C72_1362270 [compost metagenome]
MIAPGEEQVAHRQAHGLAVAAGGVLLEALLPDVDGGVFLTQPHQGPAPGEGGALLMRAEGLGQLAVLREGLGVIARGEVQVGQGRAHGVFGVVGGGIEQLLVKGDRRGVLAQRAPNRGALGQRRQEPAAVGGHGRQRGQGVFGAIGAALHEAHHVRGAIGELLAEGGLAEGLAQLELRGRVGPLGDELIHALPPGRLAGGLNGREALEPEGGGQGDGEAGAAGAAKGRGELHGGVKRSRRRWSVDRSEAARMGACPA